MKPRPIGIIGGAGPLAGAFLLEKVLSISNQKYNCYRDSDFPKIILISFPFSEMLLPAVNVEKLRKELSECLSQLRQNGAAVLAIACHTLHAFLNDGDNLDDLVHLPRALRSVIPPSEKPLVLCTSTSTQFGLHKQFFPCTYPDFKTQVEVDEIIDQILRGADNKTVLERVEKLLEVQTEKTVILGCTELSLYTASLSARNKIIIDPLDVVASRILEKSFSNNRST